MKTKKVDDLSIEELNEQVALCQGWVKSLDYDPCHNAQQAYEIIEREKISVKHRNFPKIKKENDWQADIAGSYFATGETALIAAMRCFVKSIKGEEVQL